MLNITIPTVYILHDIFNATFRPFLSATAPYIKNPKIERVSGQIYV